jgi:hypothetical protein
MDLSHIALVFLILFIGYLAITSYNDKRIKGLFKKDKNIKDYDSKAEYFSDSDSWTAISDEAFDSNESDRTHCGSSVFDNLNSASTNGRESMDGVLKFKKNKDVGLDILPSYDGMKGLEGFESSLAPISRSLDYNEPVYDTFNAPQTDPYAGEDFYEHGYASLLAEGYKDCPVETMRVFFSEKNIKRIQKMLRREISNRSYGKFNVTVDQNMTHVLIAMRAAMKLYAKFLPHKIVRQVKRLNEETVQYIVPDLMTNLKQQYSYIQDITNPLQPLPDPINVNQAGRNQLRSVTAVWNI